MSIRIGNGTVATNTTNRERIVLNTASESNMIILRADASVPSINMVFNDTMVFGRKNDMFFFNASSNEQSNIAMLSYSSNILQSPTYIANAFYVSSNATFSDSVAISNVLTTNSVVTNGLMIDVPLEGQNEYLNVSRSNNLLMRITSATNDMTYNGRIGIGTNPSYSLHVIGDSTMTNNVRTSNVVLRSMVDGGGSTNKVVMNDTMVTNAGTIVNCIKFPNTSLWVEGEFKANNINFTASAFKTLSVTDNASIANIVCSNMSNASIAPQPTLSLVHNSNYGCNVIDGYVNNRPIISLDANGRLSLGSRNQPRAMLDIIHSMSNATSNMIAVSGVSSNDTLYVDQNANVGIGTTMPMHHFHITRADDHITNSAFIGLYDNTVADLTSNVGLGAFLSAYDVNGQAITVLDKYGQLTLGQKDYSSNWTLNVASNMQVPYIQTSFITANPANCNIDFQGSSCCNIKNVATNNLSVQNLALTCNLTSSFFYADSFLIKGFELINNATTSNLKITSDRFLFTGTGVTFGQNEAAMQTTPSLEGKLKIVTVDSPDVNYASVGVNVVGSGRNSVRVTSGTPTFELIRQAGTQSEVYMGIDSTGFFMSYGNITGSVTSYQIFSGTSYRMLNMSSAGVRLADKVQVTSDGRLFINTPGANYASAAYNTQKLFVKGTAQFVTNDSSESSIIYINDQSPARVGIATTNPQNTLHIHGGVLLTSGSNFDIRNPVSVGTNASPATLTVQSNITVLGTMNVTGDITYKGATLLNSLWSTNGANATTLSPVGIGTNSPTGQMQVNGNAMFTATGTSRYALFSGGNLGFGTTPRQALDLAGSNMIITNNGRLGIGTASPSTALHVEGVTYFNNNVGIGLTNPAFNLDIVGNINFTGALYQSGALYVSSQWTTVNTSNLWYSGSNVGLGTTNPQYKLHVENGTGYFGSNVTVAGVLSAQRSVSTRSDRRVKTDLVRIPQATNIVEALNGYKYYRTDIDKDEYGLIAQEVQAVLPELVDVADDGLLNLNYGNMAAVFVEAIKGLQQQIKELKTEVATLKASSNIV